MQEGFGNERASNSTIAGVDSNPDVMNEGATNANKIFKP